MVTRIRWVITISFNRHITRNFNANKTNRIRYDDDDFTCEIFRYDKTWEFHYAVDVNTVETSENVVRKTFNGFPCFASSDNKRFWIKFKYNAKEKSDNFRLECLYANNRKDKDGKINKNIVASGNISVNGKKQTQTMGWVGNNVIYNRHFHYCTLNKDENIIKYSFSPNTLFIAVVVKKFDRYVAKRHNNKNDDLIMIKATVEHTDELQINTMSAEFMYHHELDEVLELTHNDANRSGLIFDYRDEINLYVRDTNGNDKQVFGGYISTATVDDDLTRVSMECADRMIDLDRRYCLSEVYMKGYNPQSNDSYDANVDYLKEYNNYSDSLKFLMNNCEVIPRTNIRISKPLIKRKTRKLATYRDKGYKKLTAKNMSVIPTTGSVTLRNGPDTLKPQSVVIYDDKDLHNTVEINKFPNLYFHYGLGDEKWEEKIVETTYKEVLGSTQASQKWIDRANKITTLTGEACIKPIWREIASWHQNTTSGFFQSADKTYNKKNGNCCCKTEVLLNLLNAKGLTDLKYVHCYASPKRGHVFAKVNGFYVDPSTSSESRGWHNYIKGYGAITHVTEFPNKPF